MATRWKRLGIIQSEQSPAIRPGSALLNATPTADRSGKNSAYAFDGVDDYIVVAPPPKLIATALTVSVSMRCDSTSAGEWFQWWHDCIICQDDGADHDHARRIFQLSMLENRIFWHRMMEVPDPFSIDPIESGAWYHVAAVFDNGLHKLYLNGVLNNSVRHSLVTPGYASRNGPVGAVGPATTVLYRWRNNLRAIRV
jgi:hypothetical protein